MTVRLHCDLGFVRHLLQCIWPLDPNQRSGEGSRNLMDDLRSLVETFKWGAEQTAKRRIVSRQNVLRESTHLDGGNFTRIHSRDLWRLFEEYEQYFFDSSLARALGDTPLRFSLSKRCPPDRILSRICANAHRVLTMSIRIDCRATS